MRVKTLCFIIDLKLKPAKNGKSNLQALKDLILPEVTRLEPGDCVILYDKRGVEAYDTMGSWTSAISQFALHDFVLPLAFKETVQIVQGINVDEEVFFYVISDKYAPKFNSPLERALVNEPNPH